MSDLTLKSLKGKKNFEIVFGSGSKKFHKDCSSVFLKYENINNPSQNRIIFYAVLISKKVAKKAVVRNRVKRLLRESLRQLLKSSPELFKKFSTIVLIWKSAPQKPAEIKLNDVMPVVTELLSKMNSEVI